MTFKRHLDAGFIDQLNLLYKDPTSWWSTLVNDRDVFIAIRNNWINAYCGGASLARIGWSGALQFRVHRAYLVLPPRGQGDSYIDLLHDGNKLAANLIDSEAKFVSGFEYIKKV